jgi:hypothetical protein
MRQTKKGNQWYFGMKAHILSASLGGEGERLPRLRGIELAGVARWPPEAARFGYLAHPLKLLPLRLPLVDARD